MPKSKVFLFLLIIALSISLLVVIAFRIGNGTSENNILSTAPGISLLEQMEEKDPDLVDSILKEQRRLKMMEERESRLAELENGEASIWSFFEDYMVLGDSRTMGFDFYGYLEADRVLAEKGNTILTLESHIPEIVANNPSYLFISYGANDVGSGMWASPEEYAADLARIIGLIRAQLPDINVFVNSILPAQDPAFSTAAAWYDIPEYNEALRNMCQSNDCFFIDNTAICEQYAYLYEADGVHLMPDFYYHWAINMIMGIYDSEMQTLEDSE